MSPPAEESKPGAASGVHPVAKKTRKLGRAARDSQRPTVPAPDPARFEVPSTTAPRSPSTGVPLDPRTIPTVREIRVVPRPPSPGDFDPAQALAMALRPAPAAIEAAAATQAPAGRADLKPGDVPSITCKPAELLAARLHPSEGFVLGLIDGRIDVEGLLDACPMPPEEARAIVLELRARGLITLRAARRG